MAKKKGQLSISNKVKFRKPSKSLSNKPTTHLTFKKTKPLFGRYVIQAVESGLITKNQLEAVRIVLRRRLKLLRGRLWLPVRPDRIVTKRSLETRMGRGKGGPNTQIALITCGQYLFELTGPRLYLMRELMSKIREKLSVKVELIDTNTQIHYIPVSRLKKRRRSQKRRRR